MFWINFLLIFLVVVPLLASSQDYGEYNRGNAAMARRRNQNARAPTPITTIAASGIIGGIFGGFLSARYLKRKYNVEKKNLMEVYKDKEKAYINNENNLLNEYTKLYKAYEELEKEIVERDYEEFKAPDSNGDDVITKYEFNNYVKKFLSSFPELSEADFPKFEEFDSDNDGLVNFDEWQQFLYQKKLLEQLKAKNNAAAEKKNNLLGEK